MKDYTNQLPTDESADSYHLQDYVQHYYGESSKFSITALVEMQKTLGPHILLAYHTRPSPRHIQTFFRLDPGSNGSIQPKLHAYSTPVLFLPCIHGQEYQQMQCMSMYIIYSQISVNYFVSIKMAGYGCNQQTTRKYEFSVNPRSLAVTEKY